MTNPGVCYCGEYGGGVHTKSARCDPRPSKEKVADGILSEAIDCCRSWEPEVRLIGNVRAIDLRDLLLEVWKYRNVPNSAHEPCPKCEGSGESGIDHYDGTHSSTSDPPCAACNGSGRASQPPLPAPKFQVGQQVFAGCALRKVLAISHCYKLSNTICEGSGWTMFDEHSIEPCSGPTKSGEQP